MIEQFKIQPLRDNITTQQRSLMVEIKAYVAEPCSLAVDFSRITMFKKGYFPGTLKNKFLDQTTLFELHFLAAVMAHKQFHRIQ